LNIELDHQLSKKCCTSKK